MDWMDIGLHFVYSFVATVAFAYLNKVPGRVIPKSALLGALGWTVYRLVSAGGGHVFFASMLCCMVLALGGLVFAVWDKQPLPVYLVPGLVPVVPGITFTLAFRYLAGADYAEATRILLDVGYTAIGLVCGLVLATQLFKFVAPPLRRLAGRPKVADKRAE